MAKVRTYKPKGNTAIFGVTPLVGWKSIKVTANSDTFFSDVGADGEVARGQSSDDTHMIEIEFQQTSPSLTVLNTIRVADKIAGTGILPMTIADLSGVTKLFWLECWITKFPDYERTNELGSVTVTFMTGQISGDLLGGAL